MATIREIAREAGYSPATVSRVLNGDQTFSVSKKAKEQILKVAHELNYDHRLIKERGYSVAVIFAVTPQEELRDVYFSGLRKSLIESAEESNIELSFCKNADEVDVEKIDGIIAVGRFLSAELEEMKQLGIQVLFVDSNPDPHEFNSIQPNLQMMVETAIEYFVQAGYQKIGFIGGRSWDSTEGRHVLRDTRTRCFESRARELGLFNQNHVFIGDNFSVDSGVLQAFNENKLTVPEDVSMISINDIDIAKYVSPPLTTFRIDTEELGKVAIETLRNLIVSPKKSKRMILLDADLVFRKSFVI